MSDSSPERGSFEDAVSRHPTSQYNRYDLSESLGYFSSVINTQKNKLRNLDLGIDAVDVKIILAASAFSISATGILVNADEILSVIDAGQLWVAERLESLTQPLRRF
jgi:hypothetical protein